MNTIVRCRGPNGEIPNTLAQVGIDAVLDREILSWGANGGDYGGGSAGFVGFELSARDDREREWLFFTVWAAGNWLLLDERWFQAHPDQYHLSLPLHSDFNLQRWDEVTERIVGRRIVDATFSATSSLIRLANGSEHHIRVPDNPELLPRFPGNDQPRSWPPEEDQRNAWVLSRSACLFT